MGGVYFCGWFVMVLLATRRGWGGRVVSFAGGVAGCRFRHCMYVHMAIRAYAYGGACVAGLRSGAGFLRRRKPVDPRSHTKGREELRWRSIPACAGEPALLYGCVEFWRVYPRVCGGTTGKRPAVVTGRGLSPRVRGNPGDPAQMSAIRRSIPACAGEPSIPPG